jgi:hypothetical protein
MKLFKVGDKIIIVNNEEKGTPLHYVGHTGTIKQILLSDKPELINKCMTHLVNIDPYDRTDLFYFCELEPDTFFKAVDYETI